MSFTTMNSEYPDVRGTLVQLQALIKDLCKDDLAEEDLNSKVKKASKLVEDIPKLDIGRQDHRMVHSMLESVTVTVWNHAVAMKTKGALTSQNNAKLRHLACDLEFRCNDASNDESTLRKGLMMALKSGRSWLDCSNPELADKVLLLAAQCVEKLQKLIINRKNNGEDMEIQKMEVEKERFKLLCYRAEAAVALDNNVGAMDSFMTSKELLSILPKEGAFLSMLCYNFGVETFQRHQYEEAVSWLRESYELGKGRSVIGQQNQARTLRLLANAYLEWDGKAHLQKAMNAIGLANSEYAHPAGLYLKLRILLLANENAERVNMGVDDIIKHPDMTFDLGLSTVGLLNKFSRRDIGILVLQQLTSRFESSPDIGQVLTTRLELMIQACNEEEARMFVEECITAHNTGRPLDVATKKRFHLIFWEQAAVLFEGKNYADAVQWYNYSLSLFSSSDGTQDKNLAKLHRNLASCYLNMEDLEKAKVAVDQAEKADTSSPHTQYIIFKLALAQADSIKANEALQKMSDNISKITEDNQRQITPVTDKHGLICLAAQLAFEKQNHDVAVTALECLIEHGSDPSQVLTALRCLIRIKLTDKNREKSARVDSLKIIQYLRTAYERLQSIPSHVANTVAVENEASWFMKIAWNLALQCEDCPEDMKVLFKFCSQFSNLCGEDLACLNRQKTCLMMTAAAGLQIARLIHDTDEKKEALHDVLRQLRDCREICAKIKGNKLSDQMADPQKKDTTEILLLLYEFEAKAKLADKGLESVLERALSLPYSEAKTFETIAALAMESPAQHRKISMRALKAAIRKHLQLDNPDFTKLSKSFHSLVQLAFQSGLGGEGGGNEEALTYYMQVIEVIDKKSQGSFPEIEALWLMTKAWNQGIYIYSAGRYDEAEKWCGMSLRFLKHLTTMRDSYEQQMNTIYSDILAQMEGSRKDGRLEE